MRSEHLNGADCEWFMLSTVIVSLTAACVERMSDIVPLYMVLVPNMSGGGMFGLSAYEMTQPETINNNKNDIQ